MINLDYQSRMPIYEQIVQEIERYVALEILKPEEQMPSIRDLACALSINPNTVKKAYDILDSKGIITSKSTKGTFITQKTDKVLKASIDEKINKIKNDIKEIEKYGISKEEIIKRISV